jgi:cobalt-zinc-cadmium efflux system outer membrane protein
MRNFIFGLTALVLPAVLLSQRLISDKEFVRELSYREYLRMAVNNNLLLAAEKYKVEGAEARIALAKIFPNPVIVMGNASGDITGQNLQQQLFGGISQTIPRGGKHRLGIEIAKTEKAYELALYEDYLRVFRLDVTKRFINVLIARMTYEKDKKTNDLLQSELSKKERDPALNEIELYRIKIEAGQILGQLYQSEEELKMALYDLYVPLSNYKPDSALGLKGLLNLPFRRFNLDSILPYAIEYRTDIVLAKTRYKLSEEHYSLARANRRKDINIEVGNNYYTEATNKIAPTPAYHAITALLAMPIAFSNFRREDLKLAELQIKQARSEEEHIRNVIKIEISQSYDRYRIAWQQLELFKNGLLEGADKVLHQELENYKSGKSSFLDLSESHRKLDEVYHSYFQALKTYTYSMIELEDDMGIWDIDF